MTATPPPTPAPTPSGSPAPSGSAAGPTLSEAVLSGELPAGDMLRLDRQICFSLHAASRAFNGVYRVLLKDLGLTYPQYLVMLVLWERGELPVKRLGEELRLDSGTLSPLLKRLEAAGLVTRQRSTRDERSVGIRLTPEGAALRERALRVPRRIAGATGFGLEELRDLRGTLDRLIDALDRVDLTGRDEDEAGESGTGENGTAARTAEGQGCG
ncbi:MarR family transcriptional regulator [Streptomyces albus]|uniref:MarR family transcriptional regulator n=2 Tax=Streptomyces TaxID=1883 RepID=A0A0B5EW52_STRA4|nr:MarR family transcriptional regulator [Streptomyces albus]AOU77217.1 MarR family transcriptional regulator [Streptomyces albus]AYN32995.1 MarR family transcriptional regulator [Streptomyces albus]